MYFSFRNLAPVFVYIIVLSLFFFSPVILQTRTWASTSNVNIQNMQFTPQQLSINAGTIVTWTNQETTVPHTTTSDVQTGTQSWDSATLQPGQAFSHAFNTPGTYTYHCNIHPTMTGTIIVLPNPTATITPSPTVTSTPTPLPTNIPASTATPVPGDTTISLTIILDSIGEGGDKTNPVLTTLSNKFPLHPQRNVYVELDDPTTNHILLSKAGNVLYNSSTQNFQGIVDLGAPFTTASYFVKVKADSYLQSQIGSTNIITSQHLNTLPLVTLHAGDINGDNVLDILDYNVLFDCGYGAITPLPSSFPQSKYNTQACQAHGTAAKQADLNDDGVVDGKDYNLFLREIRQ